MGLARIARLLADDGPLGRSVAALVLVVAWVATWRPQVDPDAWWHIALGELITNTRAIPTVEPFSWLTAGDRIVVHSWVWDVLLAGAFRGFGATGTSLLILPVTALIVALLWLLVATAAPRLPPTASALLILVAAVAAVPSWAPRAQTLDVAFVLATVLVLARYLRLGERRGLVALPIIGLLWANLHGSAILALIATLGLAVIALPVGARLGDWPPRPWPPVSASALLALLAAMINPSGPRLFAYPFDRSVASAFIPEIVEWRPPDLLAVGFVPFTLLLVATALVLIARRTSRPDIFILLVTSAWTVAALASARFVTIAAVLLVVAIAPPLATLPRTTPSAARAAAGRMSVLAMTAVAVVAILAVGWTLISPSSQEAAIRHRLPVAAVEALTAARCPGRLLADYGWGGYVIAAAGRQVGAYGDSAEGPVRDQLAIERVTTDPRSWLDGHEVDLVLVPANGPLLAWLATAPEWRSGYRDTQAAIQVREGASGCSLGR